MRVLFFNNHFSDIISNPQITFIHEIDSLFEEKQLFVKVKEIFKFRNRYDRFVFYMDYKLAFVSALLFKLCCAKKEIYLHEFYLPEIKHREYIKYFYFYLLFHMVDCTIVHSNEDVIYYSNTFYVRKNKFRFIPYFYYSKIQPVSAHIPTERILLPGRHRDISTFLKVAEGLSGSITIVGGKDDKIAVSMSNVKCLWEVDKAEYDKLFEDSDIVIIPLYKDRYKRSLGQIAVLKAFATNKYLIVADSPYIRDYISEDTCILYEPENPLSLKSAFDKLQNMTELERHQMIVRANAFVSKYSRENYSMNLEQIIVCRGGYF